MNLLGVSLITGESQEDQRLGELGEPPDFMCLASDVVASRNAVDTLVVHGLQVPPCFENKQS